VGVYERWCEEAGGSGAVAVNHHTADIAGRQRFLGRRISLGDGEQVAFQEQYERSSYETCGYHFDGA
jgi:hypothetical protein